MRRLNELGSNIRLRLKVRRKEHSLGKQYTPEPCSTQREWAENARETGGKRV